MNKYLSILLILTLWGCNIFSPVTDKLLTKDERKELRKKERCNRKLARVTKKCPNLFDSVEVEIPVAAAVDSQAIFQSFEQNTDVSGVDSIISRYQKLLDSLVAVDPDSANRLLGVLGTDIKRYIIERPCLDGEIRIDTTISFMIDDTKYDLSISFGARPAENNTQKLFLEVPEQEFEVTTTTTVPTVTPIELTWQEKTYSYLKGLGWQIWWWVALAAVLLFLWKFGKTILRYFGLIK